jgi:hypothetical protein
LTIESAAPIANERKGMRGEGRFVQEPRRLANPKLGAVVAEMPRKFLSTESLGEANIPLPPICPLDSSLDPLSAYACLPFNPGHSSFR